MSDLHPKDSASNRTNRLSVIAAVLFGIVLLALVINGGMCERYERKMQRQKLMRQYLDSQRAEGQRRFLEQPTKTPR